MDPLIDKIAKCHDLLSDAQSVLVTAGSGLSAAAGIDYTDTVYFARHFPGMVRRGFQMQAELVGYSQWSPELKWGYLAANAHHVRFMVGQRPVYQMLRQLVEEKDYFVYTSNADGMFEKNGFDRERIFTPQGDYALMQCQKPCSKAIWESKPILEKILPAIDPQTQEVTDRSALPRCPNCGGDTMLNVNGGYWFIEKPYQDQEKKLHNWIEATVNGRLLIIEIGAGFNTPVVVRWPNEHLVANHPDANLIRIDLSHPQVPKEIRHKSITMKADALKVITDIHLKGDFNEPETGKRDQSLSGRYS